MKEEINNKVQNWYKNEKNRLFIISGYAGCGKTYTAKQIPKMLGIPMYKVAFLTPTGKASRVLHESAQTIHSFMYDCEMCEYTKKLVCTKKLGMNHTARLLIVDEISMVNEMLLADLMSLNIPIIGLGDPAQLPPVTGENDILNNPDVFLTKVWRNDGGILELSKDIREGNEIKRQYNDVVFGRYIINDLKRITDDTVVITKFNKTRQSINKLIRERVKKYTDLLEIGEKLIVLKNNRDTGLMNGSVVTIKRIINIDLRMGVANIYTDSGNIIIDLDILTGKETQPKRYDKMEGIHDVDYAYAITCHKSQGSEFEQVMVINEGTGFDNHDKWLYTAVTRAKKKLYIYNP